MDPNISRKEAELISEPEANVVAFIGEKRHLERNQRPSPKSDMIQERWHVLLLLLFAALLGILLFTRVFGFVERMSARPQKGIYASTIDS